MPNATNHLLILATLLTVCVVTFVHVFLFPIYEVTPRITKKSLISDYAPALCREKLPYVKTRAKSRKYQCPRDGIVTVYQGGRLGNQMFEYAGVWAVARRTGLDPYVPGCIRRRLDKVFESLSVPVLEIISHCPMHWGSLVRSLDAWNFTNQSILLYRYYQDLEVIIPWVQDIRQEFTIKRKFVDAAERELRRAARQVCPDKEHTYIGVHVRRTDYKAHLWRYQHTLVGPKYFYTAMRYFERKYKSVIFMVVSDDPDWCSKHLSKSHNVFIVSKPGVSSAEQDLAVMAACNHSIIDYGTYGVWGAILAGGETIVHNISGWASTKAGELLPYWHLL